MRPAVLITGGARRVGAALSKHFASQGYDVALHYHSSAEDAEALKKDIEKMGAKCELFQQDLGDTAAVQALMDKVKKTFPNCNALVNNASLFERGTLMGTTEEMFDRQFSLNFKAPFFLTQAFAGAFGKGAVVNILDTDIRQTQGVHFAYLLSKKTLAAFTEMAARELGPHVRVNAVCPGIMLPSSDLDVPYIEKLSETLPLKQIASVEQAAEAACWLCGRSSVTGQLIFTDGGQHLL